MKVINNLVAIFIILSRMSICLHRHPFGILTYFTLSVALAVVLHSLILNLKTFTRTKYFQSDILASKYRIISIAIPAFISIQIVFAIIGFVTYCVCNSSQHDPSSTIKSSENFYKEANKAITSISYNKYTEYSLTNLFVLVIFLKSLDSHDLYKITLRMCMFWCMGLLLILDYTNVVNEDSSLSQIMKSYLFRRYLFICVLSITIVKFIHMVCVSFTSKLAKGKTS